MTDSDYPHPTLHVMIECRPKSAMQSGRTGLDVWRIVPDLPTARDREPVMGWTRAYDTLRSLARLTFPSCEKAVAFAARQGWGYRIRKPNERRVKPRTYLDKFKRACVTN